VGGLVAAPVIAVPTSVGYGAAFGGIAAEQGASARYAGVLLFSMIGGLIPGTLFSLAVRVAPSEAALATTVGWVQQWSSFGQFVGPPIVAWVASLTGAWQSTWLVTGACSCAGCTLALCMARLPAFRRRPEEP